MARDEIHLDRITRIQLDKLIKASERQAAALERIATAFEPKIKIDLYQ